MRVYLYKDRIKKYPLLMNSGFKYSAFSCIFECSNKDKKYLTEVAEATFAHYIEAFRIADMQANKCFPQVMYKGSGDARSMMCGTYWLNKQIVEFTKHNPQYSSIWTTTRANIAARANRVEYFRATKLLLEGENSRKNAAISGNLSNNRILADVHVANLTEFFQFNEKNWQIPVIFTNRVVINEDGRKHHGEPKGKGAAIFSSDTDSFLYLPKNKEPYRIKKNSITGSKPIDCETIPGPSGKGYYGYVNRVGDDMFFYVIHKDLEFRHFNMHGYFIWKEPNVDRIYFRNGMFAHSENGIIVPNERIPDIYRNRCGLE